MIKYIKGDLFSVKQGVIAHGCNCLGLMGSGIAKIMVEKYPSVYKDYKNKITSFGLGENIISVPDEVEGLVVINMLTQQHIKSSINPIPVSYDAIRTCFEELNGASMFNYAPLSIPKIGAGLGGGDWYKIEQIIKDAATYDINVYEL